ncbi:MAG TPA: tetratricopeptide repeat protein, partial [Gemmataceae bacterium]|nr:tetratricopeptide repeat protein [Gemmataceae bacterium]
MARLRRLPLLTVLLVVVLAGVIAGAAVAVRHFPFFRSSRDDLLRHGYAALDKKDLPTATVVADTLANRGFVPASHLLRGKIWLARSNRDWNVKPTASPYEDGQEAAQLVMAAAALSGLPPAVREMTWLSNSLVQQPFSPEVSPAQQHLRKALAEFTRVHDDGALGVEASLLAGTCLIELGDRQAAAAGLEMLAKHHPDNKEPHRLLAAIYLDLNAPTMAV